MPQEALVEEEVNRAEDVLDVEDEDGVAALVDRHRGDARDLREPRVERAHDEVLLAEERLDGEAVERLARREEDDGDGVARARGVGLIGDVPIFVSHDSADVWANPGLFELDRAGRPRKVSGVPPDMSYQTIRRHAPKPSLTAPTRPPPSALFGLRPTADSSAWPPLLSTPRPLKMKQAPAALRSAGCQLPRPPKKTFGRSQRN